MRTREGRRKKEDDQGDGSCLPTPFWAAMLSPEMQKAPAGNWGLCEIGLICLNPSWAGFKSS
ncbi:hypothetical protein AB7W72_24355, partial [Providencia rettgeri]